MGLLVAILRPAPAPAAAWAYVDVLAPYNFPTWFGAALLLTAALALGVAGVVAGAHGRRDAWWWAAAALGPAVASLCVATGLHRRVDGLARQAVGENPLTTDWLPAAVVAGLVLAVPFVVLARRVPGGHRIAGAVAVLAVGALGSELLVRVLGDGGRAVAAVAEGVQLAGAAALLVVAVGAVRLTGDGELHLVSTMPADTVPEEEPSGRGRRAVWPVLVATTAGLAALSLLAVLAVPAPGPRSAQWIGYLDVDSEGNLPTWWSVGLLVTAAAAHLVTGLAARSRGAASSIGWCVTAAILAAMSLDDMTSIHEEIGDVVRPEGTGATDGRTGFSFYWVVPGAVVAVLVAIAVGALALRLRGRPRRLLVTGLGVLFFFGLGVEALEGVLIAAGGGGRVGEVLAYHVEELGENAGALLLLGAATSALAVRRRAGALLVRYVGDGVARPRESDDVVDPPTVVLPAAPRRAPVPH